VRQPDTDDDFNRAKLEELIVDYLEEQVNTTLRGRFFDIGKDKGKREYAQWLANEMIELDRYIEKRGI